MVKKIFTFIEREISGVHEAAYILGFFAILSQLLALLRDRLFAHSFGAGETLDLYYAAFRIPDFIFVTVASLVSISVLIPFLISESEHNIEQGKKFINSIFTIFFFGMCAVSIVVYFLIPRLLILFFPDFVVSGQFPELITLTRLLLLSPFFLGISNLLASVTQLYNRYIIYALSPLFYNLGIIIGVVFFYPMVGIVGLGYGVVLGAFLHMVLQIPFIVSKGFFPKFSFHGNWRVIRRVLMLSLPRTLALSANELAKFALISLASFLSIGSISIFTLSYNMQSVPLSIIGVSYSLAIFPTLSRLYAQGNKKEFIEKIAVSTKHIIFLSLPVMTLFVVLRAQIVRTILGSGAFDWQDTRLTAAALAIFVLSLIPQSLVLLFARAYYSMNKTLQPLMVNVVSSLLIILCGYVSLTFADNHAFLVALGKIFRVSDVLGIDVLLLALSYAIGVTVNCLWHWVLIEKECRGFTRQVVRTIFQSLIASLFMGLVAYSMLAVFDNIFNLSTVIGIFMQGFLAGIVAILVWALVLKLLGSRELTAMIATLQRKIWRVKVVPPDMQI